MGALHSGHTSLIEICRKENDICVVSIFVNPTQFNDKKDLQNYPRDLEKDSILLEKTNCDIVFTPSEEEMYPSPDLRKFDFGTLETVMEGKFRPGHFNGVGQVVSKLFEYVNPDKAYFGEKDFQQLAIIKKMTSDLKLPIKIIGCPIVREDDGLAKSSRNQLLSVEERKKASLISKTLFESRNFVSKKNISDLKKWVIEEINSESIFETEYFEIVNGKNLEPIFSWDECEYIVGCVAVFCNKKIRLIDNITYKNKD